VSQKSERLVNLTIALLATKRYLTKSEIFKTVAGYSGEADARDRMFERDKDDLRSLGIEIELGTFDPLFEDEAGYRIKPEKYSLQLDQLSPTQLALLSHASLAWKKALLGESAHTALRKLKALGIESDFENLAVENLTIPEAPLDIPIILEAISERRLLTFEYLNTESEAQQRTVAPYRLYRRNSRWYLIALDIKKNELRTFRVDRFASTARTTGASAAFAPNQELLQAHVKDESATKGASIAIRKGRGNFLRALSSTTEIDSDWDLCELSYKDQDWLIRKILWLCDDAKVVSPIDLQKVIIERLEQVSLLHG
jgi:proteasome accessory factor B